MKITNIILILIASLLLASCATHRYNIRQDELPSNYKNFDASKVPNAIPKVEPRSRYGNSPSYVVLGKRYHVLRSSIGYHERGIASYYGVKFHNFRTSSGEIYNMYGMTAANKVLPLPTFVRVTNLENNRQVIVKVNDRGPFHANRIIDLSFTAAKKLDMIKTGTALVEVVAIDPRHPEHSQPHKTKSHTGKPTIYLQMGAFSTRSNAEHFERKLRSHTQRQIRIVAATQNKRTLYRVQIGPLANVDEADKLTTVFKKYGLGDAFAVVD